MRSATWQEQRRKQKEGKLAVSSDRRRERRQRLWLFVKKYWHRLVGAAVGWFAWDFYYCEPLETLLSPQQPKTCEAVLLIACGTGYLLTWNPECCLLLHAPSFKAHPCYCHPPNTWKDALQPLVCN